MVDENTTYLSYSETESVINEIIDCKDRMSAIFEDFKNDMANVGSPDVLAGATEETLSQRFATLETRFSNYTDLVQQFADDIRTATEMTNQTDKNISNDAQVLNE